MDGLPDELTTPSIDSEISGADPAGAMHVSSAGIRAVEQVLATLNSLRAVTQIQQSCDSLKEDMVTTLNLLKLISQEAPFEKEQWQSWMAIVDLQLIALSQDLNHFLKSFTDNAKHHHNIAGYPREDKRIQVIQGDVKGALATLKTFCTIYFSRLQSETTCQTDVNYPQITTAAKLLTTSGRFGHVSSQSSPRFSVLPLKTASCTRRCNCLCHHGSHYYSSDASLPSLLGPWVIHIPTLSILYQPSCDSLYCRKTIFSKVEFHCRFPTWLAPMTATIRCSWRDLVFHSALLVRSTETVEVSTIESWIGSPDDLIKALRRGSIYQLDHPLDTGAFLLEWMIYQQYFKSAEVLVRALPARNIHRQVGYAINWTLAQNKDLTVEDIELLRNLKALLDHPDLDDTTTEVHAAVCDGEDSLERLQQAVKEQPWAICKFDSTGRAPIHLAVQYNRVGELKFLVDEGANVNQRDARNQTPLQLAASCHRSECLWALLETKKCLVDQEDNSSTTALHLAARAGSVKAVAMLLDARASATRPSKGRNTPLHLIALAKVDLPGAKEIVSQLQSKNAELNARDEDGNTPAMIALSLNNLPVLQALFEAGASLHLNNDHSQNILHFAARYTDANVLEYLNSLELEGINPELPDKSGNTPKDDFRWAMRTEDSELVSPLRRPCPATQAAFTQLYSGVQARNLESDLKNLRQLLHSVEQSDWNASCIKLSTLISWKETFSQHQQVERYQRILRSIEDGRRWDLAMKQIQIDVQDTTCRLEFAQSVLAGFVDPFLGNTVETEEIDEDLDTELEEHSCWLAQDGQDENNRGTSILHEAIDSDVGSCGDEGPTHQEPEGGGIAVETMGLLSTLPDLVDLAFSKVPTFFEPPVPAGETRVRWKCVCGDNLFDDFTETTPGSLVALRARLSDVNRTHNSSQKQSNSELQVLSILGNWMKQTMIRLARRRGGEKALPTINLQVPRHGQDQPNREVLHLLLCIDKGETLTRLHQDRLHGISEDKELFSLLRESYFKHRKFTSWFTLRSVKNVSLARFKVDANYFAGVHDHSVACSSQCVCLPPVARIESNEYRCAPAPKAELGYFPALGPRELLHYFKKPHDFEIPQRSYLNQIPKRACGQLRATQDQAELGWGLHFEEGWHWKTIYFIMVALVAVPALVFGVAWSVAKGDIQGAFAISGTWIALGPLMLGYMAIRDV